MAKTERRGKRFQVYNRQGFQSAHATQMEAITKAQLAAKAARMPHQVFRSGAGQATEPRGTLVFETAGATWTAPSDARKDGAHAEMGEGQSRGAGMAQTRTRLRWKRVASGWSAETPQGIYAIDPLPRTSLAYGRGERVTLGFWARQRHFPTPLKNFDTVAAAKDAAENHAARLTR